jgi:hypothetical protein
MHQRSTQVGEDGKNNDNITHRNIVPKKLARELIQESTFGQFSCQHPDCHNYHLHPDVIKRQQSFLTEFNKRISKTNKKNYNLHKNDRKNHNITSDGGCLPEMLPSSSSESSSTTKLKTHGDDQFEQNKSILNKLPSCLPVDDLPIWEEPLACPLGVATFNNEKKLGAGIVFPTQPTPTRPTNPALPLPNKHIPPAFVPPSELKKTQVKPAEVKMDGKKDGSDGGNGL